MYSNNNTSLPRHDNIISLIQTVVAIEQSVKSQIENAESHIEQLNTIGKSVKNQIEQLNIIKNQINLVLRRLVNPQPQPPSRVSRNSSHPYRSSYTNSSQLSLSRRRTALTTADQFGNQNSFHHNTNTLQQQLPSDTNSLGWTEHSPLSQQSVAIDQFGLMIEQKTSHDHTNNQPSLTSQQLQSEPVGAQSTNQFGLMVGHYQTIHSPLPEQRINENQLAQHLINPPSMQVTDLMAGQESPCHSTRILRSPLPKQQSSNQFDNLNLEQAQQLTHVLRGETYPFVPDLSEFDDSDTQKR
ncbi:hypothetical protein C1645_762640 [Glomus cerebriforme]|uniref:Uncharacterized protein n=1 Tax=Glomus cerebriforme TaxID=658196 RepID=A0A397T532_9GLOM|nr:hypothetical protein C1645_762640 [Glomus cerebriforme]